MNIDSHQHFWRFRPADYGWIREDMPVLRRDFMPQDLEPQLAAAGIDGVVSVQARQSEAETAALLQLAREYPFIRGVVGWVPLASPDVEASIARFAEHRALRGVRHVLHDEPDDRYALRDDFNRGVSLLRRFNLAYDILIVERHLPYVIEFIDRHPEQVFIVDHIAKPRIKAGALEPWRTNLREIARRPGVYCKLSGMVTEAAASWTPGQLQPYFDATIEAFGPQRLMFGSDWPVCLLACGYRRWCDLIRAWIGELSPAEQRRIMGGTAIDAYGLEVAA